MAFVVNLYFFGCTGGSSTIHGQMLIVVTLVLLFLITVTFMIQLLWHALSAPMRRSELTIRDSAIGTRSPQVVDDDVDEPGTKGAVLFLVLRLFAVHERLLSVVSCQ